MTPFTPLAAARQALARWQLAGQAIRPRAYADALRPFGQEQHYRALLEVAARYALPQDATFDAVATAVLAGANHWREQLVLMLFLPWLRDRPGGGASLRDAVADWRRELGDAFVFDVRHTRALARMWPRRGDALSAAQAGELFDWYGVALPDPAGDLDLWTAGLAFWGEGEMVPALLARVLLQVRAAAADDKGAEAVLIDRLQEVSRIVDRAPDNAALRERLVVAVAAMLGAVPGAGRPLLQTLHARLLLGDAAPLAELRPSGLPPWGALRDWYRHVAVWLETAAWLEPHRDHLRRLWVQDVGHAWSRGPAGVFLVVGLYQCWLDTPAVAQADTEALVGLLRALRRGPGVDPAALLGPALAHDAAATPDLSRAAQRFLDTRRMLWPAALAGDAGLVLLARVLSAPAAVGLAALAEYTDPDDTLGSLLGGMARAARAWCNGPNLTALLWEVLLAPRRRRPGLRARLVRMANQALLDRQEDEDAVRFAAAAGRAVEFLSRTPEGTP
jgi:hypothetical protein